MPRVLTCEDRVSNKIERFKARKDSWDILLLIPFAWVEGKPLEMCYGQTTASGKRADGTDWVVALDEDHPDNNIALQMGGRAKEQIVSLVLHLGSYDAATGGAPRFALRFMPWAYGGDKFEMLKMIAGGQDLKQLAAIEIAVRCSPSKEEKYQDLIIQACPDARKLWPIIQANPQALARVQAQFQKGLEHARDFLTPDTRQEQFEMIRGNQQGNPGMAPGSGAPAGMDLMGLPPSMPPQRVVGTFTPAPAALPAGMTGAPPPGFGGPAQGSPPGFAPPGALPPAGPTFSPPANPGVAFGGSAPAFHGPAQPGTAGPPVIGGMTALPGTAPAPQSLTQPVEDPNEVLSAMLNQPPAQPGPTPPPPAAAMPREDVPF